jgi:uncharacterized protein (TIGR03067 family)
MRPLSLAIACALILLTVGCGKTTTGPAPSSPAPPGGFPSGDPKELTALQGTWTVVAIEAAGKKVPDDRVEKLKLQYVFNGEKVTVHRPDRPDQVSTFTLDAAANPKRIAINHAPPVKALYSLDGNKLRLCLMVEDKPDAGFPGELASRPSPKTDLLTLERR